MITKEYRIRVTGSEGEQRFAQAVVKDLVDTIRFHIKDVEYYTSEIVERTGFLYGLESIETLNEKLNEKVVNKV